MYKTLDRNITSMRRRVFQLVYGNSVLRPRTAYKIIINSAVNCFSGHNQTREFRVSFKHFQDKIVVAPTFPESITEGEIRWSKKEGDLVAQDEVICEIETDKTAIPVLAPSGGQITKVFVPDGTPVKQGQQLFSLKPGPGAPAPTPKAQPTQARPTSAPPRTPSPQPSPKPPSQAPPRPPPPPPQAKPSTPAPAIVKKPESLVRVPPQDPTKTIHGTRNEQRIKMTRLRSRVAERLKGSQNTYAMLTTFNEVDMSNLIAFRTMHQKEFGQKFGIKLGFMSPFIKAAAYALQQMPVVNAVIDNNEIIYRDYVDISVAVATPKGLLAPVIRNVQDMNFADIELSLSALSETARKGTLPIEDMIGGTFTISNGGVFGSLLSTPIINPPQSAILGMHSTQPRPVAVKGQVVIRPMMYIALTYDHRLIDGREGVLFLKKIKSCVEDLGIITAGI